MKTQRWFRLALCAVGLALISSDASRGQDAQQNPPAAAQPSQQPPSAKHASPGYALDQIATTLGLYIQTHANPIGVEVAPVDDALRAQLNVADGVVVTSITPDSEAAKAGLKQHDIVLNIDKHAITGPEKFNELVGGEQGKKSSYAWCGRASR